LTDAQSTPAGFDPYAEFLHLPPGPRPPHFYDLLGVELFCAHRERIEHAARERYRLIKPFQDHRDRQTREAVQTIITRIANARIVLTDPEKRATYDQRLAEALGLDRDGCSASEPPPAPPSSPCGSSRGRKAWGTGWPCCPIANW
jgi:curved DNA-binding protein CbpA